jgi:hypothetical protein
MLRRLPITEWPCNPLWQAPEMLICPDKILPDDNKDRPDLTYTCKVGG